LSAEAKVHIAIFVYEIGGGAFANIASALAKGFVGADVDVDVIYVHRSADAPSVTFPPRSNTAHLGSSRAAISAPALAAYLRGRDPDVLVSLGWLLNPSAVIAKKLSRWRGTLLLNEQSSMSYKSRVEHRHDLRFRFMPIIAQLLYPRSDGLIAPSGDVLQDLRETARLHRGVPPLRVIANPVDVESIQIRAREQPEIPGLLANQDPLILAVGRLERQKNFPLLVKAFAKVRKHRPARLLILGEGSERSSLESLIGDLRLGADVSLPGAVKNPYPYMAGADMLALSSEEEGFGLVLVEAMSVGCPVVATRCPGGPADILEEGRSGVLTSPGDPDELAAACVSLLEDEDGRKRLSRAGKKRASAFVPEMISSEWLRFIDTVRSANSSG
jgi:glycosyltransferase involved in cell wall biosynthesis